MKEMLRESVPLVSAWLNPLHIKFDQKRNRRLLKDAQGLLIVRHYKASFGVGFNGGYGIVLAKLENGWSGPTAVSVSGLSLGFQIGAAETHFIAVLSKMNVHDFYESKSFSFGSSIGISAFFVGRSAEGLQSTNNRKSSFTQISKQRGFFTGFALEGKRFKTYNSANREYYGLTETSQHIFPWQILLGKTHVPKDRNYTKLIELLQKHCSNDEQEELQKSENASEFEENLESAEEENSKAEVEPWIEQKEMRFEIIEVEESLPEAKKTLNKRIVVQRINEEQHQPFINPFMSATAEYIPQDQIIPAEKADPEKNLDHENPLLLSLAKI